VLYKVWVFVHLAGVFGFLVAHGSSAAAGMRLRKERDPVRVQALLELSASTRSWMYVSLAVLAVGGVAAGIQGHWFDFAWVWWSMGILVLMLAVLVVLAVPYYRMVRGALAGDPGRLDRVLSSRLPLAMAAIGGVGLIVLLWLMVLKPGT